MNSSTLPAPDWSDGIRQGLLLGAAVLVLVLPPAKPPRPLAQTSQPMAATSLAVTQRQLDLRGETVSAEAVRLARWVVAAGDNGDRVFAIVDKKDARVLVFEANGRLAGSTPVLLGYAAGDDSVAGIGQRPIALVRPEERTTPAGRFEAKPGRNTSHEDVLWVDYENAVSMHRVRPIDPTERRLERLASPTPSDNRISYGCINMPVAFFEAVLWPMFRARGGVVYVLPERKALTEVFPAAT